LAKGVGNLATARTVLRDKLPSVRAPFVVFYFSPLVGARAMTGFATPLVARESRDGTMSLTGDTLSVLIIRIVPGPMGSLDLDRLPRRFFVEIKSGKMNLWSRRDGWTTENSLLDSSTSRFNWIGGIMSWAIHAGFEIGRTTPSQASRMTG
jgi:hypothetical protein